MSAVTEAYASLNAAQRTAVDQLDGPLLVVAGPGTGKTQLLSVRVAAILEHTDTLPQNILCLTFTESGATNMRERLTRFIGQAAYDVNIATYHAFGDEVIKRHPQYMRHARLERPVDNLGKHQLIKAIVDGMSYDNPLKNTQYHLHDLISTVSDAKRALLEPADLRALAADNQHFLSQASEHSRRVFADFTSMPRSFDKAMPYFESLLNAWQPLLGRTGSRQRIIPLADVAIQSLRQALAEAASGPKPSTKPLTAWKNKWLVKNRGNQFIVKGELETKRLAALAKVLEQYAQALRSNGWYDFDDMVLEALHALEHNDDLRFTLQEQYQYLLLDEFQDTNAAQLKLVELLTNNPVSEGRPNVMAVGDDDQAIYAFQGARFSNMRDFKAMYRDTAVVNLSENYRSHKDILQVAGNIAGQISERLDDLFGRAGKQLKAGREWTQKSHIVRHESLSDLGQYDYIAAEIERLIKAGTPASEIAVLAPKHKYLEPLVPFLNGRGIAVRYEKRENILETPVIKQLLQMSRLVLALHDNDRLANTLWPEVLSYDFWELPLTDIWQTAWRVRDTETDWSRELLASERFKPVALLLLGAAAKAGTERLEVMLDYLIGTEGLETRDPELPLAQSPLKDYYTSRQAQAADPDTFYEVLTQLSVLRARLRDHLETSGQSLTLEALLRFVQAYEDAGERMLNVSPYNQQAEAVQLMTVFKAKGLEFEHVFVPACHDDVWGDSSRGDSNRLTLPANLGPIRPAGTTADERLRLFFVALTRAKRGLYLTSYRANYGGKTTTRLKYLDEQEQPDGSFVARILPANAQLVERDNTETASPLSLALDWGGRHRQALGDDRLRALLTQRLASYRLSASNLNTFMDMVHGGPDSFLLNSLLRFPQAPSAAASYGTAIHAALQQLQESVNAGGALTDEQVIDSFETSMSRAPVSEDERNRLIERGRQVLTDYVSARRPSFVTGNQPEVDFYRDNVLLNDIRLSGKLDRLDIDQAAKELVIVDYKTGKSFNAWSKSEDRLRKYRRQLYFYKLLVEHSRTYRGWTVTGGRLEFVEPDEQGSINCLELRFDPTESAETEALIKAVWRHIMELDLPDTADYDTTPAGSRAFEAFLLGATLH